MSHPTPQQARLLFARMLRTPGSDIDLAEAALLISAVLGNDVDVDGCLEAIERLGYRVQALLNYEGTGVYPPGPFGTITAINRVLFEEEGFAGNSRRYYSIENSLMDRVLAQRTGIPITLSILYMAVARRAGLEMHGIGLPGHFAIGHWSGSGDAPPDLIVDPFNGGRLLTLHDCAARVYAAYGGEVEFTPQWLQPLTTGQVLARVLNNIKYIYVSGEQLHDALKVVDLLLLVQPDAIWELKERGLLYYRTGAFLPALADLRHYMKLLPAGEDSGTVKYYVDLLRRLVASAN